MQEEGNHSTCSLFTAPPPPPILLLSDSWRDDRHSAEANCLGRIRPPHQNIRIVREPVYLLLFLLFLEALLF